MTVSGVHEFTLTRDEIIREALELTATIDINSAIPAEVLESCARSLNLYIKAWQAKGLFLHTYQQAILPLIAGATSYLLGPGGTATESDGITLIQRPLQITDVRLSNNNNEPPLLQVSMAEYMMLTIKNASSRPTQYAYDPQLDNSRLYIWPASSSATDTILFTYQKPVDDFTTGEDTAAIPVDWLQAFTIGLAYHIAPKRLVPLSEQKALQVRYEQALMDVSDFEETSFFVEPA